MDETLDSGVKTLTASELFGGEPIEKAETVEKTDEKTEKSEAQKEDAKGENEEVIEEPGDQDSDSLDQDNESESDEGEEEDSEPETETKKPKKISGAEKRIKKLIAKNAETKRLLAEKDREIELLRSKIFQDSTPQAQQAAGEPKMPSPDDFETYEAYLEARDKYNYDKAINDFEKRQAERQAQAKQKAIVDSFDQKLNEFKSSHDDYDEVMDDIASIGFSDNIRDAIISSEYGPALAYELAKNPEEFKRICALPDLLAIKEIGKFETKLSKPEPKKTEVKKTTKAPPPPNPVGANSDVKKTVNDPDLSPLEFFKLREEQEKQARKNYYV